MSWLQIGLLATDVRQRSLLCAYLLLSVVDLPDSLGFDNLRRTRLTRLESR